MPFDFSELVDLILCHLDIYLLLEQKSCLFFLIHFSYLNRFFQVKNIFSQNLLMKLKIKVVSKLVMDLVTQQIPYVLCS